MISRRAARIVRGLLKPLALIAAIALLVGGPVLAQSEGPVPLPVPAPIAPPQDKPYPGVLRLSVDATDLDRRIFRVRETVPVAEPGPFTLLFPRWLPGKHWAAGELEKLAGLVITANGQAVEWSRDPGDITAFHVMVPAGAKTLELEFQFVSATEADQGRVVVTQEMLDLQWNNMALYPAGYFTRRIPIEAEVKLPKSWGYGTALELGTTSGDLLRFKQVTFDTLVDSPVFAGRWFRKLDLDPGGRSRVTLNIMADDPGLLSISTKQIQAHRDLVVQADRLFTARHFDHYDILLALTDRMGGIGLEHQRSSENATSPNYFADWAKQASGRDLLPHEYTHSWNGKYRRPADLWTANFNQPMGGSLLWVYEGQTQYWGYVLGARSGLLAKQDALDAMALTSAIYDVRIGRSWRRLADTGQDPVIAQRRPQPWVSWQRSEDYYSEGALIWLDVDTLIRERSGGRRSLDDFAKAFFGVRDGDWGQLTYDLDEVVRTLNTVEPNDWSGFFKARLDGHGPSAPLDGLARGGYRLIFTDTPSEYEQNSETRAKSTDLTFSLGVALGKDGELSAVQWDGPAFNAGLTKGQKIIAVNGLVYDPDRLKDAISGARGAGDPVELIVKSGDRIRVVKIPYRGGLRYPHLERIPGTPDRLGDILEPRK